MTHAMHYEYLDGHIHQFTFYESSASTAAALFAKLDEICADHPAHRPFLLLSDSTQSGSLPIVRVTYGIRQLRQTYGTKPFTMGAIALVVKNRLVVGAVSTLVRSLGVYAPITTRVFDAGQQDEARAWLARIGAHVERQAPALIVPK